MKEAEGDQDQPVPLAQPAQEPANGKAEKDMKGLVYQGGGPPPTDYPAPEAEPAPEEPAKGDKDAAPPHESDSILTFTEKDSRTKVIVLFALVVVIIIGVAYLALHSKALKTSITLSTSTVPNSSPSNSPTTTVLPNLNKSAVYNLDILYDYSGPPSFNGADCGKSSTSTVQSYRANLNASTDFYLYDTEKSGLCPLTIGKIAATTPGFRVLSVNPATPLNMPANSSSYLIIKLSAPPYNYTGPLSLTISEN